MNDHSEQLASGSMLITVNQRLARHHLARYQQWQLAQGRQWWETPTILPLRAWLRALHGEALANGLTACTLLPDLRQQKIWRECIEMDQDLVLLDVDAATSAARTAWELSRAWQCFNPEDDYLSLDQYTWQRWCSRYQRVLESGEHIDEANLAEHIVALIATPEGASLLPSSVIYEGFLELPPQVLLLTDALREAGVCVEVASRRSEAHVVAREFADDEQEMLSVAGHMRHELEQDENQSLGLVVPDLQNKRAAVMRAFDRVFFPSLSPDEISKRERPYDLSLGMPLSDASVVKAALSFLTLSTSAIKGSEISAVLLSPYWLAAFAEARRRELMDRRLRNDRVRSLTLKQLQEHLYSGSLLSAAIGELLQQRRLDKVSLSDWAVRFSDWLNLLGWPGKSIDTEEYQAVSAWHECLDDMQLLDGGEVVTTAFALRTLQRLARERIFQLETPSRPIQIMGRLESHGIDFDCLWVVGLDTEQWPPTGSPSPFLSIAAQKQQGVPGASAAARLALAEREFFMWGSQAPVLFASHVSTRDGKVLDMAAIPQMTASEHNVAIAQGHLERMAAVPLVADPMACLQANLSLEATTDEHGPLLPAGSEVSGGARLFEDQALCPFRAFALHRLRIRSLEEAGLGLDPRQHGNLLHSALELFWKAVGSHDSLMALSEEAFEQQVQRVIDEVIDEAKVPAELRLLEQKRLGALLVEWVHQCEVPREAFEVVSLEQRQSIEHGGVVMNVMLDRIDRVGGALVVLDYKTGASNKINTWADQRIINPQLPLYVLTNEDIEGASFAQVVRNQCSFKGVASDASLLPKVKTSVVKSRTGQATERPLDNWSDWRAHWLEALDIVATEVREGLATVTPMKTACQHCELKSLCRIDEAALVRAEEDEGSEPGAEVSS